MMTKTMKLLSLLAAPLAVGCLALGCVGATDSGDVEGHSAGLYEGDLIRVHPGIEPLASARTNAWRAAPRDCHGLLPSDVSFELVGEGLVVAMDAFGNALCVDSIEDVQEELEGAGRAREAAALEDAYLLAMGLAIPDTSIDTGDPSPQPSCEDMDAARSDTTPTETADSVDIAAGDPSPQPSTQPSEPDDA